MIPTPEAPDALFHCLCGVQVGTGMHRGVHEVVGFPDLVIKVSKVGNFANWCEYLVSSALEGRPEPIAGLVGTVKSISSTGKYLIMERLSDVTHPLSGLRYPSWLNDGFKRSAYGMTASGTVKVRDYGSLKLGNVLEQYRVLYDVSPVPRIVASGDDGDYAGLVGDRIAVGDGRSVHEVVGHPDRVIKICSGSHRANMVELFVHWALSDMNAEIAPSFATLECSRSGAHLLMERLADLPADFSGARPDAPSWLRAGGDSCLGLTAGGEAKFRTFSHILLGDVLARATLTSFP